jgi:hypothetical protein
MSLALAAGAQGLGGALGTVTVPQPGAAAAPGQQQTQEAQRDPHPTTYAWAGEVEPIYNPTRFYSFYYTGTVTRDATASFAEPIRRIPVQNNEYEAIKASIVDELTAFYERAYNLTPAAPAGTTIGFTPGLEPPPGGGAPAPPPPGAAQLNPSAAAEWTFYCDQFVLWQFYCKRVLLNEPTATSASSPLDTLRRRKEMEDLRKANPDLEVNQIMQLIEEQRRRSAQQQPTQPGATPAAVGFQGGQGVPAAGGGGQQQAQPATVFDLEAIWADPELMDIFHGEFVEAAKSLESRATTLFQEMLDGIAERREDQAKYDAWLADQQQNLLDWAVGWGNVAEGSRLSIQDQFYLLTSEPVRNVPYDSINIIVGEKVTPQDLLTREGRLKGRSDASGASGNPLTRPPDRR